MIYGLNFNRTPIPDTVRKRFPKTYKHPLTNERLYIQGGCETKQEAGMMAVQANNGHRIIYRGEG